MCDIRSLIIIDTEWLITSIVIVKGNHQSKFK